MKQLIISNVIALYFLILFPSFVFCQANGAIDSDSSQNVMETVVIHDKTNHVGQNSNKSLGTIEEYLESGSSINMLKRGAYGWETIQNGMTAERSVLTIDGMRIYAACTDKMDPVTSYLDISQTRQIELQSGASGKHLGGVAGNINIQSKKGQFGAKEINWNLRSGYETNNQQKILGLGLYQQNKHVFVDANVSYRGAENYKDGDNNEVLFSTYTKYNLASKVGIKLSENSQLVAQLIYDRGVDIGYPGLPMDVKLAEGLISSLTLEQHRANKFVNHIESKIYFNSINHIMDDSKRPNVPIRMDMPGKSLTGGWHNSFYAKRSNHNLQMLINTHLNTSIAEMTMYANNEEEKDMYMLTWPGVTTYFLQSYFEDSWKLNDQFYWINSMGLASQYQHIYNDFGLSSLQIFYPEFKGSKFSLLPQISSQLKHIRDQKVTTIALGYSHRAASVSEAYGFYLFNSQDRYDYIGNPLLKNEKAFSLQASWMYTNSKHNVLLGGNYFYIRDYIVGVSSPQYDKMTIGAKGTRIYEAIEWAHIANVTINWQWYLGKSLMMENGISYRFGKGKGWGALPQIQPLQHQLSLVHQWGKYGDMRVSSVAQSRYYTANIYYGEHVAPAYFILNMNYSKNIKWQQQELNIKLGIDNILNHNYTTFSDWNSIPRMGRNIYVHLIYGL